MLLAINVGNSRTHLGVFEDGKITRSERFKNAEREQMLSLVSDVWKHDRQDTAAIVMASVNDAVADHITSAIKDQTQAEVYRIGDDVPVPIGQQLDPETMTGVDRLLNAAGAYDILKQACVVVDAGTAITVDFVDGEGTFQGGAIAPGASMQLCSLHQHTAALPELVFRVPDNDAFGRNTSQAMYHGVFHGIRGMVQRLVEHYAEAYGAFPVVVATGGDAHVLFENEALIDRIVPDLTLMGIEVAARYALDNGSPAGESHGLA